MSALPPKADIAERNRHVRFVPKADIVRCGERRRYSITSSALADVTSGDENNAATTRSLKVSVRSIKSRGRKVHRLRQTLIAST